MRKRMREMTEKNAPEIERKYLIAYPDMEWLAVHAEKSSIVQTYLASEEYVTARVRKREWADRCVYYYTEKKLITAVTKMEYEREIDREEYESLLAKADRDRKSVLKDRYCLAYKDQLFEIDVYPFYTDRAIMEIEMESEEQKIDFPPEIRILKEVTSDRRYSNASMAKNVPYDKL